MGALKTGVGTRPERTSEREEAAESESIAPTAESTWAQRAWPVLALTVGAIVMAIATRHLIYPAFSWNRDEITYLWQADALRAGKILTTDGNGPLAYWPWLAGLRNGSYFSQYTIGWPVVLAGVGIVFGSTDLALAFGTVLAVLGTYVFARELTRDKTLALVAGVLMLFSPIVVIQSGIYLSYLFALGLGLFFGAALLAGLRRNSRLLLLGAGVLLGWVLLTRPFDVALWAMPVAAYAVLVYWRSWRLLIRATLFVALGFLPFVVITLLYNRHVTGSFTEFPLTAKDPLDTLGFGARRLMPADSTLDYTIGRAFRSVAHNIRVLPPFVFGSFLAIAVAAAGMWVRRRDRTTLVLLAIMAVFPVAYFFFWGNLVSSRYAALSGPLYYVPLFAPLCVLVAAALLAAWKYRRGFAVALGLALVAATIPPLIAKVDVNHTNSEAQLPWKDATSSIQQDALVIVENSGPYLMHLNPYSRNSADLDGTVLFAVDLGPGNLDTIAANPARTPYLEQTSDARWDDPVFAFKKGPVPEISLVPLQVVGGNTVTLRVHVTNPRRDPVVVVYLSTGPKPDEQTTVEVRTLATAASGDATFDTTWTLAPSNPPNGTAAGAVPLTAQMGDVSVGTASGATVEQALAGRQTQEHFWYRAGNDGLQLLYPGRKFVANRKKGTVVLRDVDNPRALDVQLTATR